MSIEIPDEADRDDPAEWEAYWRDVEGRRPQDFATLQSHADDLAFGIILNTYERNLVKQADAGYRHYETAKLHGKAGRLSTIAEALAALSPDDDGDHFDRTRVVHNIEVVLDGNVEDAKRAYFICDDNISFRHAGEWDKKPKRVFVRSLAGPGYDKKVIVLYSASGSGKTVELAASAVTRDAHLAFVLSVEEDASPVPQEMDDYGWDVVSRKVNKHVVHDAAGNVLPKDQQAERAAYILATWRRMNEKLAPLVRKSKAALNATIQAAKNQCQGDNRAILKIVLAVDEASSCPKLVRSIARDPENSVITALTQCLFEEDLDDKDVAIDVQVTVAGTGLAPSTVGSLPDRFITVDPSHEVATSRNLFFSAELSGFKQFAVGLDGERKLNTLENIQQTLPVVAALMENGRMGSIAIAKLKAHPNEYAISEAKLVDTIVQSYMSSNGMCQLQSRPIKEKQMVAALAFAVHLFKKKYVTQTPGDLEDLRKWASEMKFDFPVDTALVEKQVDIETVVRKYGLLEPTQLTLPQNKTLIPPLMMRQSQQLVAAHMIGVKLEGMLQLTPYGFEFLSTHFLKAAIAATYAISFDRRPNLQEALKVVGLMIDDKATEQAVISRWNTIVNWKPIGCFSPELESARWGHYCAETRPLNVELRIIDDDELEKEGLQIDREMLQVLECMGKGQTNEKIFSVPTSCINHGNSPLPDGFVTFMARETTTGDVEKWTIMVQAKDYYATSLDGKKLNQHADRAGSKVLDDVFGSNRLLCVASCHDSLLVKRQTKIRRKFIPYNIDSEDNLMMQDLLVKMARDEQTRISKYAAKHWPDAKKRARAEIY